jgi:hypothetical protein
VPAGTQAIVWLNATQLEMFYGLVIECDATREIKSALAELSPSTLAGRSMLRPYGKLLRQGVRGKKAGAGSRTPQNRGEAPFGVRRLAAAFTSASEASAKAEREERASAV